MVSRVLTGYDFVKDSTRSCVMEAVECLGYVANLHARGLAGGRSQIIGLLLPGLDNGHIGEVIRGVDQELARASYHPMMHTTHRRKSKESLYVNAITNGLTDGLLLNVPLVLADYLDALRQQNFTHVLIDQANATEQSTIVDTTKWQDEKKWPLTLGLMQFQGQFVTDWGK